MYGLYQCDSILPRFANNCKIKNLTSTLIFSYTFNKFPKMTF